MQLKGLQQDFLTALFAEDNNEEKLSQEIHHHGIEPAQRLAVYANTVRENMAGCLRETFPVTMALLGEGFFRQVAYRYAEHHPLPACHLNAYGDQFPAYLGTIPPLVDMPYIADIAALEWAWQCAYDAADAQALSSVQWQMDPEQLAHCVLTPHPSLQMTTSPYPVHTVWTLVRDGQLEEMDRFDMDQGGEALIVIRPHLQVQSFVLEAKPYAFIAALWESMPVGKAVEYTLGEEAPSLLPQVLRFIIEHGLFIRCASG